MEYTHGREEGEKWEKAVCSVRNEKECKRKVKYGLTVFWKAAMLTTVSNTNTLTVF
jgi:hypothetical protein